MKRLRKHWSAKRNLSLVVVLMVAFLSRTAFAAVTVANQTGTIAITTPTGEVITVEAGQPLPSIASGSTIEVITGTAEISATGNDSVQVLVNNATATLTNGATVQVKVDLQSGNGTLNVVAGSVTLINADGTTQVVTPGAPVSAPAPAPVAADSLNIPGNPVSDPGGASATGY